MGVYFASEYVFEKGLFQLSEWTSCLLTILIWQVIERAHVVYISWFSWRYESLLRFGIRGPRFFQRVAATMTSKRFVKVTLILFKFIIYASCGWALTDGRLKSKIVRKTYFGDIISLTSHDCMWLNYICFLYCAKEGIVEISKVS